MPVYARLSEVAGAKLEVYNEDRIPFVLSSRHEAFSSSRTGRKSKTSTYFFHASTTNVSTLSHAHVLVDLPNTVR